MQRSSSGRFIKTPCDGIRYDYDMLGNFIGISSQLFSPKKKKGRKPKVPLQNLPGMQAGNKAGKKKKASEGTKTHVTKKLRLKIDRLKIDTEFIAAKLGRVTSREGCGNLKQVRLCMLIVCLSLMLIHTC